MHKHNWFGAQYEQDFEKQAAVETQNRIHAILRDTPMLTTEQLWQQEVFQGADVLDAAFNTIDALTALKLRSLVVGERNEDGKIEWEYNAVYA